MLKYVLLSIAGLTFSLPAHAEPWVRITSPHFTVISNGSEKQARQTALAFEQIHAIIARALPGLRTDSGTETIVIAAKDENSFKELLSPAEKKRAGTIGGEFRKGWEKDYVLIRLDIPDINRNVVFHEYVHKLLHLNFTRLPVWLDEGLAEFLGNTELSSNGIYIGAPSPRIGLLRGHFTYPLATILSVGRNSPYYRDEDKVGLFYAESWGLTHFLMFGPNMENGRRMNAYLQSLHQGEDSAKAFHEAFGELDEIQKQFSWYVQQFSFKAARVEKLAALDPSRFEGGPISPAEIDARMGNFFTYARDLETANQKLTAALTADPKSSLVHENAGFLYFQQGQDEQALKEFDQAAELNPNSYLALYYQAMLRYHGKADSDSMARLDAVLEKVLQLNPRFAPALIVRSQTYVHEGRLQDAYQTAVRAQQLEPDRAGYLTNVAAILLLGRNYSSAIKVAGPVAPRWSFTDGAEALAVIAQARRIGGIEQTADEKAQEEEEMKYAAETTAVEGIVKSISCEKAKPLELVLQAGDDQFTFRAGRAFGIGFSDTLWFGEDHFNPCYHLEGMKAVARYHPSPGPNGENQLRWLEIRDELIPSTVPALTK